MSLSGNLRETPSLPAVTNSTWISTPRRVNVMHNDYLTNPADTAFLDEDLSSRIKELVTYYRTTVPYDGLLLKNHRPYEPVNM